MALHHSRSLSSFFRDSSVMLATSRDLFGSKGAHYRASSISNQIAGTDFLRCHSTKRAPFSKSKSTRRPIIIKARHKEQQSSHPPETAPNGNVITKTIHFQRHGQGYHNLLWRAFDDLGHKIDLNDKDPRRNPFVRPEIVDSPLTSKGIRQCENQRELVRDICRNVQLIVMSPLLRTMQTAHITFADYRRGAGSEESFVPWMAHDGCREELGMLTCNKRRKLSQLQDEYPNVDTTFVHQAEEDELWFPQGRESIEDQSDRIYRFLTEFVRHREETEIAVVGHSAWLSAMTNHVMEMCDAEDNEAEYENMKSGFEVSEIRSMLVSFHQPDV